jgi:hypothetical protein
MTRTVAHNPAIAADWLRSGSLCERPPGVWQVRVSIGRDPVSHRYQYASTTVRGGRREANRAGFEGPTEAAGSDLDAYDDQLRRRRRSSS